MAINEYDQLLETLEKERVAPKPAAAATPQRKPNAYDQLLDTLESENEQQLRTAQSMGAGVNPQRAGEIIKLANRTGLPVDVVERNYDDIVKRSKIADTPYTRMLHETPALTEWLKQPMHAAAAADDHEQLGALEKALKIGKAVGGSALAGLLDASEGTWGAIAAGAEMLGSRDPGGSALLATFARGSAEQARKLATDARGEHGDGPEAWALSGIESLGAMSGGLIASVLSGNPGPMLAIMGGQTFGQSYAKGRDEGLSIGTAGLHAGIQGAIEVATEYIPAHKLLGDLKSKAGIVKTLIHQLASEIPGEEVATALQDLNEWAFLPSNKDKTFTDYLRERPTAAVATAVSVLTSVGATVALGRTTQHLVEKLGERALASTSLQQAPEAVEQFLETAAKQGGARTVYAPVTSWNEYWQSEGVDPRQMATELTGDPQAYEHALESGELPIPTARYITKLAGTKHNGFFATELRIAPGVMNARETDEFVAKQEGQTEVDVVPDTPADRVAAAVKEQLVTAGVEASTADEYAKLHRAVFSTFSEALPGETSDELYSRYGLRVRRPALEDAAAAPAGEAPAGAATDTGAAVSAPPPAGEAPTGAATGGEGAVPVADANDKTVPRGTPAAADTLEGATAAALAPVLEASGATLPADGEAVGKESRAGESQATSSGRANSDAITPERAGLSDGPAERDEPGQIRARAPRSGTEGTAPRGASAVPATYRPRVALLLDGAKQLGFSGTDDSLSELFLEQLDDARQIAADVAVSDDEADNPFDLLKAISAAGGFSVLREGSAGYGGELQAMLESLHGRSKNTVESKPNKKGVTHQKDLPALAWAGLPGATKIVQRKDGLTADGMREALQQDPRWESITDNLADFMQAVDEAIRIELGSSTQKVASKFSVDKILTDLLDVRPGSLWWSDTSADQPGGTTELNGSGESSASLEAISRNQGMRDRGETFVVYDRAGNRRPIVGVDAVDYHAYAGETFGIEGPNGFTLLEDNGGRAPAPEVQDLMADVAGNDLEGYGDTSFDISEFDQDLFDLFTKNEDSPVDTLVTDKPLGPGDRIEYDASGRTRIGTIQNPATRNNRRGFRGGLRVAFDDEPGAIALVPAGQARRVSAAVDILSTGEQQPRLPGDVGAVREQEVKDQPIAEFVDEFRLTAPEETQASQRDLFQSGREVTQEQLDAFTQQLKERTGPDLVEFSLIVDDERGGIYLDTLAVTRGAQRAGVGTAVMQALTSYADVSGATIRLAAVAERATDDGRLMRFYERFGFTQEDGGHMVREPNAPIEREVTATPAFRKWFGDSKVVDEQGQPLVVYKGGPAYDVDDIEIEAIRRDSEFPAFNSGEPGIQVAGFYSSSRDVASHFAMVTSNRGIVWPVYLSIQKPFTIDAGGRPSGTVQFGPEGATFREAVRSGQYDGIIIRNTADEGDVYVALKATQAKSAIGNRGTFDANDERMLYQDTPPADALLVQHNVSAENVRHILKMGGIAVPSLAIVKASAPIQGFGEITLIGPREMADPKGYAKTKVFGADVYSPRYPTVHFKLDRAGEKVLTALVKKHAAATGKNYYDLDQVQTDGIKYLLGEGAILAEFLERKGLELPAPVTDAADVGPGGPPKYADHFATRRRYEDVLRANNLEEEFRGFVEELFRSLKPTERIYRGFNNQGNRTYRPHTLENVVKILQKELRAGEGMGLYGVGALRAHFTPQFRSLKAIQNARDLIVDDATFEKVKKEVDAEFFELADSLKGYYEHDASTFQYSDTVLNVLADSKKLGIRGALREYGFDQVSDVALERIAEYIDKLRHLPTEYFEAKITREVDLSEFTAAVVPDTTPADVIDGLRSRGLTVETYHRADGGGPGTARARTDAIGRVATAQGDRVLFQDSADLLEFKKRGLTPAYIAAHEASAAALEQLHAATTEEERATAQSALEAADQVLEAESQLEAERLYDVRMAERKGFQPQALAQDDKNKGRRGVIRFGKGRQFSIELFEKADLSTFLHESGHFFLEVYSDVAARLEAIDPAARTPQQLELLANWEQLRGWLGAQPGETFTDAQHEQWARGFEAYLMEGNAPSLELRSAFTQFRAWLLGLYRSLTSLNVTLTPEVRKVMGRMLATERAIQQAQQNGRVDPVFTTKPASMSDAEWTLYRQQVADSSRQATEQLELQLMAEVQREQERQWKVRREEIRQQVQAEVFARPEVKARAAIYRGTTPAGEPLLEGLDPKPLKLDKQAIVDAFGADRLKRLPRPPMYVNEGGFDPALLAEMMEFTSTDAMLTALENLGSPTRIIEQETDRRMQLEHGSLLLDGTLHEKARQAVANESRESVVRAELAALTKAKRMLKPALEAGAELLKEERRERDYERRWLEAETRLRVAIAEAQGEERVRDLRDQVRKLREAAKGGGARIRAAIPPDRVIRELAARRIAGTRVRDLKPERYWHAARQASQAATSAAARQEFDKAISAKQTELLNLALYREAAATRDDVQARAKKAIELGKGPALARLGKAGQSYVDQVRGVLARFEFVRVPLKELDRRASLRSWVESLEEEGLPAELPEELLNEALQVNYQDLTVEQLIGVTDGLKMIAHLARLKNRLLKARDAKAFDAARLAVVQSIRAHNTSKPTMLEFQTAEERRRRLGDIFASHTKIGTLARILDGGVDGGAMWEQVIRPLNAAADDEQVRRATAAKTLKAIRDRHYTVREQGGFRTKREIAGVGPLSKEARLAVALNWGNETSRERLLNDPRRKWKRQQVEAILETLDERDWQFVQDTWDYLDSFWPDIAAKQERVTGLAPEKVAPAPVTTKYGEFRGGYYPLAYDGRLSARAQGFEQATTAKLQQAAAYVRTTTKRGHVEARKRSVQLSVKLDLGVAFAHVDQVLHDLTHHETLIDVSRLVRDTQVATAILETRGDVTYRQFTSALQDIASNGAKPGENILDRAATFMRTGTQIAGLGWNVWTALQQPLGLFNGASRVGPRWVLKGMGRWLKDAATMERTTKWIYEVSPFMRSRGETATQDLRDLKRDFEQAGGWFDTAVRTVTADKLSQGAILDSFLWHIGLAQKVADVPTWLGAYEKARHEGNDEARSAALADQAVIDSQGSGQLKDLSAVQRGGPVAKLFMTFYSYGATLFNSTADVAARTRWSSPSQVGTFLGHMALLYIMPAMGTVALGRLFRGTGGDDDDLEEWLVDVARESLSSAMNTMVLLREGQALFSEGARGYEGAAGSRLLALLNKVGDQVKQGEVDEALLKALNSAGGVLFRYPAGQVQRTVDGIMALEDGRTSNPLAVFFGPPREATR